MGKRGKSSSVPRHKRMTRQARLQAAKHWIPTYLGENIVKGYSKHFGVDLLCAVKELEMLAYRFTPEYKEQLEKSEENRIKQMQVRKSKKLENEMEMPPWSDATFYFIAGYTSGGVPYGVTWEEMASDYNIDFNHSNSYGRPIDIKSNNNKEEEDEIPF